MTLRSGTNALNATECFLKAISHTPGGPAASIDAHLKLARVLIEDALKLFASSEATRKGTIDVVQAAAREAGTSVYAMADLATREVERHDDAFIRAKGFERHAEETLSAVLAVLEERGPGREKEQANGLLGLLHSQRARRRAKTGCTGEWC